MTLEQVYSAIGGDYKGVMERLPSADFVRRFERYTPDYYLPLSDHSPVFADATL